MVLEVTNDTTSLVAPSFIHELMVFIVISCIRYIVSATCHCITEPAVHHTFIDREVDDELFLTVVDTGEHSLLRLSLDNLHLLDHVCREVL